jgi:hypothetical protein
VKSMVRVVYSERGVGMNCDTITQTESATSGVLTVCCECFKVNNSCRSFENYALLVEILLENDRSVVGINARLDTSSP